MEHTTRKQQIYAFFDQPTGFWARLVQVIIVLLIFFSTITFGIEYFYQSIFAQYERVFHYGEIVVVVVFTLEYLIRLLSAPNKQKFVLNFYNIIDLIAVVPFYFALNNLGILRTLRVLRILRTAKLFRQFWSSDVHSVSRIVQENVIKNLILVMVLLITYAPVHTFFTTTNSEHFGDIMFAASILALAAMFGFFSLNYGDMNPRRIGQRTLVHITTAALLLPVGVMFLIIQQILKIQLGQTMWIFKFMIWFVYGAVVLWDFWNVLRVQSQFIPKD